MVRKAQAGVVRPLGVRGDERGDRSEDLDEDASSDGKRSIRMMADRILVAQSKRPGERRSRSGILIPATAAVGHRLLWGDVVATGPTVRNVHEGDRILFSPDDSFEVDLRGDAYLIVRERDIHAVASQREEGGTGLYL